MDDKYISLMVDYMDGTLEGSRKAEFEKYVAEGYIKLDEIEKLLKFDQEIQEQELPQPSKQMTDNFYQMLGEEMAKKRKVSLLERLSDQIQKTLELSTGKWAFAAMLLIIGVVLGRSFSGMNYKGQMDQMASQISDMQEMMAITMLEEGSVSKRLQGVQMSSELVSSNQEVASALLLTLNHDESSNVRLAALNMLAEYSDDPTIREGLINSIQHQESPVVLLALAELMVDLQEKKALKEFNQILEGNQAPDELKTTLRENIDKIM